MEALRKRVGELEEANKRLKSNMEISKGVLKNYEQTIEKLHTQIEKMKAQSKVKQEEEQRVISRGRINGFDRDIIDRLLKDIEDLNGAVKSQSSEIAILKFENDKLHNLFKNKESLLEEKRNELDQAYANYEEMIEEKNYNISFLEEQLSSQSNLPLPDESLLFSLVKIHQKERQHLKSALQSALTSLTSKSTEYLILEEKLMCHEREHSFLLSQISSLQSELSTIKSLSPSISEDSIPIPSDSGIFKEQGDAYHLLIMAKKESWRYKSMLQVAERENSRDKQIIKVLSQRLFPQRRQRDEERLHKIVEKMEERYKEEDETDKLEEVDNMDREGLIERIHKLQQEIKVYKQMVDTKMDRFSNIITNTNLKNSSNFLLDYDVNQIVNSMDDPIREKLEMPLLDTSSYDSLEKEATAAYQTLLSFKKEIEFLHFQINKLHIQNQFLKSSINPIDSSPPIPSIPSESPDSIKSLHLTNCLLSSHLSSATSQVSTLQSLLSSSLSTSHSLQSQLSSLRLSLCTSSHSPDPLHQEALLAHQLSLQVSLTRETQDKLKFAEKAAQEALESKRLMEAELEGVKQAFYRLKEGEGRVESKGVMIELEVLRKEREDVIELKEKFMNARKKIFNWDDKLTGGKTTTPELRELLGRYGDSIPIRFIRDMLIDMHEKYVEHLTEL